MTAVVGAVVIAGQPAVAQVDPSVTYPDGLVLRVARIETMPSADGATCDPVGVCRAGLAAGNRLVRVTIMMGLPATAATSIPLDVVAGTASGIQLRTRRGAAAIDCGNLAETDLLCTDLEADVPTSVDPGTQVALSESFDVPASVLAHRDQLTVVVQPPVSSPAGSNPLPAATFSGLDVPG